MEFIMKNVNKNGIIYCYVRFSQHLVILNLSPFSSCVFVDIVGKDLFGYVARGQA